IPIAGLLLLLRAISRPPWSACGQILRSRKSKASAALLSLAVCALVCWGSIWACYHFRFDPTPVPGAALDNDALYGRITRARLAPLGWILDHHLLPEALVHGVLDQISKTRERDAFFCGEYSDTGWPWYFPAAMVFKTPVTTQLIVLVSLTVALYWLAFHVP